MNLLAAALLEVVGFLESRKVPYMVVGGFAALHWGRPRLTRDIDLTVDVAEDSLDGFVTALEGEFAMRTPDPLEFARRNHILLVTTRAGVPADLMLAMLPYQVAALRRAVEVDLGPGKVRLCSPEDLIVYKLASERVQDAVDVEDVIVRQGARLDRAYLDARVGELAEGLERPEIVARYRAGLTKAGLTPWGEAP